MDPQVNKYMKKKLIIYSGPMGSGKTTALNKKKEEGKFIIWELERERSRLWKNLISTYKGEELQRQIWQNAKSFWLTKLISGFETEDVVYSDRCLLDMRFFCEDEDILNDTLKVWNEAREFLKENNIDIELIWLEEDFLTCVDRISGRKTGEAFEYIEKAHNKHLKLKEGYIADLYGNKA